MARIRTIKPEFPQSESMGRVSRDARLLFVLLWTVADDVGRLRGDSRMLARILYPYDDGEDGHIKTTGSDVDSWLRELEREGCIARYVVDGKAYVQIVNWVEHQKIDKPSKSKLPPLDESSRILASPRESSRVFSPQQTRTREGSAADQDQDQGKDLDHTYAREESTVRNGRNHVDAYAEFQRIKAAYPKFAGRQDWINAQARVTALVEDGEATYDELFDAVTRYAAYIRAKGSEGTQFVKTPGRFFEGRTADAYWRQTWEPPSPAAVNGKALTRFDRVFGDGEPEVDEHGNKIQF